MDTREVYWTQELQWAINDLQDGVEGAKFTDKIATYFLWKTRNRTPDADDKREAKLLQRQGFTEGAIGCALELNQKRVAEAIA